MGPRLGSRGRLAADANSPDVQSWLQWGHGWVAVEDLRRPSSGPPTMSGLQWGHGWVAVEDRPSDVSRVRRVLASMGPRLGSRGRPPSGQVSCPGRAEASMGPRLGSRGRRGSPRPRIRRGAVLQWGHGWVAVEDDGERARPQAVEVASMGPRLGSRGRPPDSFRLAASWVEGVDARGDSPSLGRPPSLRNLAVRRPRGQTTCAVREGRMRPFHIQILIAKELGVAPVAGAGFTTLVLAGDPRTAPRVMLPVSYAQNSLQSVHRRRKAGRIGATRVVPRRSLGGRQGRCYCGGMNSDGGRPRRSGGEPSVPEVRPGPTFVSGEIMA